MADEDHPLSHYTPPTMGEPEDHVVVPRRSLAWEAWVALTAAWGAKVIQKPFEEK